MHLRRRHHLPEETFDGQPRVVALTVCTAERVRWLAEASLAEIVAAEIMRLHADHPVIGYCLMPDHLHAMVCTGGRPPRAIVQLLKGRTSRQVRRLRPELAPWQTGYWDRVVRREDGLFQTLRYMLMNPVRAGLVEDWWEHPLIGAPLLGPISPTMFDTVVPEDALWRDLLGLDHLEHDPPPGQRSGRGG